MDPGSEAVQRTNMFRVTIDRCEELCFHHTKRFSYTPPVLLAGPDERPFAPLFPRIDRAPAEGDTMRLRIGSAR